MSAFEKLPRGGSDLWDSSFSGIYLDDLISYTQAVDPPETTVNTAHGRTATLANVQTLTIPSGIPDGAWMILALHQGSNVAGMAVPSWTTILTPTTMNTRRVGIYAKIKTSGETQVAVTFPTTAVPMSWMFIWGTGKPIADWQIGALELRAAYGASPRNWARCPSVNVLSDGGTALAIAFEATNALESPDTVLSYDNGFVQVDYHNQGTTLNFDIETIWAGEKTVNIGATGVTTVLYRNAQDNNGAGIHIIIPAEEVVLGDGPFIVGTPKTFYAADGTIHAFDRPTDLRAGDILIAHLRCQSPTWPTDWTPPSGWVRHGPAYTASAEHRVTSIFAKTIVDSVGEPLTYTFTAGAVDSRRQGDLWVIRNGLYVEAADGTYGGTGITNGSKTSVLTPVNHNGETNLVMFFGDSEFASPNNHIPASTPTDFTQAASIVNPTTDTAQSRTYTWVGTKEYAAGSTIPETSISWTVASGSAAALVNIQGASGQTPTPTKQIELGDARVADAWVYDGTQVKTVSDILVIPRDRRNFTVSQMDSMIASSQMVYWAHRGSSLDWSEMTMRAYTNAVWYGMRVLEATCMQSQDGVWILSHDTNLLRVTGQSLEIVDTPSANMLDLAVTVPKTGGVIGRLDDLLAAYPNLIIMLDRKARGNAASFLAMAQSIPNATEHVIIKFDGQYDRAFATTVRAAGFKTAGYIWDTNFSNLDAAAAVSDYLGLNWDASQANWDSALAYNKPMWGHVCQTLLQAQTAMTKGAKIIQCASVKAIAPKLNDIP